MSTWVQRCAPVALPMLLACGTPEPRSEPVPELAQAPAPEALRSALPDAPWTIERDLASEPFETRGAPSVIVHAPLGFDAGRPLRLAIFLHGWSGCARVLMGAGTIPCRDGEAAAHEGWDLAGRFDEGGSDALFVIPQLALMQRNGSAGRFEERGHARAFLSELLAALGSHLGEGVDLSRVESISLFAHSAGYETALAFVLRGEIEIRHVVLFDALYRGVEPFLAWAEADPERKLVSLYTGQGRTARQSAMLAGRARTLMGEGAVVADHGGPLPAQVAAHRVVIARSPAPHGLVPARHLAELIAPLGLSDRE